MSPIAAKIQKVLQEKREERRKLPKDQVNQYRAVKEDMALVNGILKECNATKIRSMKGDVSTCNIWMVWHEGEYHTIIEEIDHDGGDANIWEAIPLTRDIKP